MEEITGFITNVGLITSHGPHGNNVMACEWTHQLSYDPPLIAVCVRPGKTTFENIQSSKEFGVNIAAFDQNVVAGVTGIRIGGRIHKPDQPKLDQIDELVKKYTRNSPLANPSRS